MTFWSIVRQRCWGLILVVAGVCIITFIISHLIPGDPARLLAGDRASDDIVQGIRQQLGWINRCISSLVAMWMRWPMAI